MKDNDPIWALGTMSGTSLDGVDGAFLRSDGVNIFEFGRSDYRPYSVAEQAVLRRGLGQWRDGPDVGQVAQVVEAAHVDLIKGFWEGALVGFHGQTLAHDPDTARTHQAGDGARLARALGLPVAWDFRSADVVAGGQGAPLAPFFHFACAKWIGASRPIGILNLGGVGNLTYVDPSFDAPEDTGALVAFDTGPANAPVNDLVKARLGLELDVDGALASKGTVDNAVVAAFLADPFFDKPVPKSLDRNDFPGLSEAVRHLSEQDAAATLIACASGAVAVALKHFSTLPAEILVAGGGRKNPAFMKALSDDLPVLVRNIDDTGLDGDMLEAQAFAYLAIRVQRGLPISCPSTTGVQSPMTGGQISLP